MGVKSAGSPRRGAPQPPHEQLGPVGDFLGQGAAEECWGAQPGHQGTALLPFHLPLRGGLGSQGGRAPFSTFWQLYGFAAHQSKGGRAAELSGPLSASSNLILAAGSPPEPGVSLWRPH